MGELDFERLFLAEFPDGAIAVDFRSGSVCDANPPAAAAVRACIGAGTPADAEERLVRGGVPADEATRGVSAVLEWLGRAAPPAPSPEPDFRPAAGGYVMCDRDGPILWLRADGLAARRTGPRTPSQQELLWAAPHLLALQGRQVLHASAVRDRGGVAAMVAGSGTGKTTTAGVLAGGLPVAEDLTCVAEREGRTAVATDGERRVREWARRAAPAANERGEYACEGLAAAHDAPYSPLAAVWFLERSTSGDRSFEFRGLASPAAFARLLANSFGETGDPAVWRRTASLAEGVVRAGLCRVLIVPDGIPELHDAAALYTRNTAS